MSSSPNFLFSFFSLEIVNLFFMISGIENRALTRAPINMASIIIIESDAVSSQVKKATLTGKMFCRANITDIAPIIKPKIRNSNMLIK